MISIISSLFEADDDSKKYLRPVYSSRPQPLTREKSIRTKKQPSWLNPTKSLDDTQTLYRPLTGGGMGERPEYLKPKETEETRRTGALQPIDRRKQ